MSWDSDSDIDYSYGYDDYVEYDGDYGYDYDTRRFENYEHKRELLAEFASKQKTRFLNSRKAREDGSRQFKNYEQGRELLAELASQRETGAFIDVVVQVEGREFPCHRAVLASTRYFKTMLSSNLTESSLEVIRLHEIDSTSFSKILDFLYTGEICIGKEDAQDILQTAHMLQLEKIVEYCREFIQDNLCPYNCLGVMSLADLYGFSALKKKARDMAVSNFPDVTPDEFFRLSVEELADILGDDHLKVTNEDDVVDSVIRWLDENHGNDQKAILRILQEIRLSCLKVSVLQKLESHPVIQESEECLAKITAAREKHFLGTDVEGEDESSHRQETSDSIGIIVGGWRTAGLRNLYDEQSILSQPTPLQCMICLDPDCQQYYDITTLPTPVSGYMSVASAGRHLYVTGGRVHPRIGQGPHSAPSRQAFRYDFPSDTWLRLPDMPRGRAGHQSVVVDGKLFVVGGDTEATSSMTMDCFDPEEGAWIEIHVRPLLRISSTLKVTAFRDKIVFIDVQERADDRSIDGNRLPLVYRSFGIQQSRGQGKLFVHSLDVKANVWRQAETYVNRRSLEHVDILATAIHDKLYIRTRGATYGYLYILDAEEETLTKGYDRDCKASILRCEDIYRYMDGQEGIVGTIRNYTYGRIFTPRSIQNMPLPFALFGHSFLQTKKCGVGWYCRDLEALEIEDEREGSDDDFFW